MTKSALTGGFSGVPGGSAHFARLSRRELYLMEEPPIKAVRLAFPAAVLTSRACPAGSYYRFSAAGLALLTCPPRPYYGKSAFAGGFSGVPGGAAHFTRLSRRVLLSLFGGGACFAHLSAAPLYEKSAFTGGFSGVPGGSRTHGLSLRRRTLYPAELRKRFRCCFILGARARFVKRNAQSGGGTLGTKSAPLCG